MALAVGKLYKNGASKYQMKLIAGKEGLSNLVQWVHIIEDEEACTFLHGKELVFTAGLRNQNSNWLMNFVKNLEAANASAFVINIGPHIREVPKEVIQYCNEIHMPLFTIPWVTRMVDMTRDFCERIIETEVVEQSLVTCIQNILFKIGDVETHLLQMERYGHLRNSSFCFICVKIETESYTDKKLEKYGEYAEKVARSMKELFIHFIYNESLFLVLVDYTQEEINKFIREFQETLRISRLAYRVALGVSSNLSGILNQIGSFNNAMISCELALKQKQPIVYYDKLGFYKILLNVRDKKILDEYYQELVGKVEKYDNENGTKLVDFLVTYIENNGSPQTVSKEHFIHRNTVNNTLKKIERITGYNMLTLENKLKCAIGLLIRDIM